MSAVVAAPKYDCGDTLLYVDRHGRRQTGVVHSIEASWHLWESGDREPLIIYTVEHPTYHTRHCYVVDQNILSHWRSDPRP